MVNWSLRGQNLKSLIFKQILMVVFLNPLFLFSLQNNALTFIGDDSSYVHYNRLIEIATKNKNDENFANSLTYFDSAFKIKDFVFIDYYFAFESAVQNEKYNKANEYIINGVINGLDFDIFQSDFKQKYLESEYGVYYKKIEDSLKNIHNSKIDTVFKNRLFELYILDQQNREDPKIFLKQDSLNFESLIELTEKFGFPTFKSVGMGLNYAETVLWHHRNTFPNSIYWKKILLYINFQIEKGNLDTEFLTPYKNY